LTIDAYHSPMTGTPPYGPPFLPPPKPKKRWGLIVAIVLGTLVLCCGCGGGLAFALTSGQVKPAGAAADSYVKAVIAGDDVRALQYVCTASDSKANHDSFAAYVRGNDISGDRVVNTSVTLWNLSWRADVQVELTGGTGTDEDWNMPMAKEDGKWKVCVR
jgi:hypothetical protein